MSDMIPVAAQHPILLDVATKDTMTRTGEPMAPLSFRGFRLHTVWTRPSGGDLVCQVAFPRLLGEATASMLEYEEEKFPQSLMQGSKMAINLRLPPSNHWNIVSDLVLPLIVDTYRQWREAKHAEQDPEGESAGAEGSPKEAPAPGKAPQVVAGGSKAAFPTETTHHGERALETTLDILKHIHAIHLQTMHDMGGMRELEQTLVRTLMAEFARLQLILGEDLTKSLSALCSELETSSGALSSDLLSVLNLHSGDLAFPQVKELIQKHQQSISMKVNLPLMELEAAREDLGGFLQRRLSKLSSHSKSQEMIEELSQTLLTHANRIREAIQVPGIQEPAVFQRVMLGPEVPRGPASPKMEEGLWGHSGAPTGPDAPGASRIGGSAPHVQAAEVETEGNKVCEQGGIDLDQTLPGFNPEDAAAVIISDDDETGFPVDTPQAVSTPKVEPAWNPKGPLEDRSPRSSPPKKWATEEKEESPAPQEAVLPQGVMEEDILPKRYETFTLDNDWVQRIRCSLLGLEAGTMPSRRDIDTSSCFVPQAAVSELDLPEVITDHWLPILRREGLLMECPPDQFTTPADWVPLYTHEGLQKHLLVALSSFPSQGAPSLTAIVPLSSVWVQTRISFCLTSTITSAS